MNGTITCNKKSCNRLMYNNEAHTVSVSNGTMYVLCPDCAKDLHEFVYGNVGDMIKSSMTLGEINKMLQEKASRYAEERFMMMGFPQLVALPV